MSAALGLRETADGVRFEVRVKVRASRTAVLGISEQRLDVALAAPPVEGAANDALCRLLADFFALPRRDVQLCAGEKNRRKLIELRGVSAATVQARLEKM